MRTKVTSRFYLLSALLIILVTAPALARNTDSADGFRCEDTLFVGPSRTDRAFYQRGVGQSVILPVRRAAVRTQCLRSCVLNATLTWLERMSMRTTGRDVRLSVEALFGPTLIEKTLSAVRGGPDVDLSSDPADVFRALNEYGVTPEAAWTPRRGLAGQGAQIEQLLGRLNAFASRNRGRGGERRLRAQIEAMVYETLERPPARFLFGGQFFDGIAFAKRLRLPDPSRYALRSGREMVLRADLPKNPYYAPSFEDYEPALSSSMIARVRDQIDRGLPVLGNLEMRHGYVDSRTGVVSDTHVRYTTRRDGFHFVVFVGYELDPSGRVSGLYFQNSWGPHKGVGGVFLVTVSYLKRFDVQFLLP